MKNIDLREKIVETGIRHWELAEAMGIHPSVLSVKLRRELPEDEKAKLREIIDELAVRKPTNKKSRGKSEKLQIFL